MADAPDVLKPTPSAKEADAHSASGSRSSSIGPTNAAGEPFRPGWRFVLAFSSLSILTLMVALDATSLSVALPIIARKLNGSALQAFWAGTSFLLTSTVFQPPIGAFSHIFGRKPMLYISLAFFLAGSIICALADNFTVMLVGRCIQGAGGGGVITLTEILVTDLVPLRERGKWFSMISSMWSLGTVAGPLLGGGFAQNVTWRWIFWINLPFIGVGTVMIALLLTINYQTGSFMAKLARVDWVGTVVFVAATTGFLIPITWGGVMYDWDSWRTLVPLIVCGVALVAFLIYEEYVPAEPMIRSSVFKQRTAAVTYFDTFIHGMLLWCMLYYAPIYFEAVKGLNPIMTGVALFPVTFTVAPSAMVSGFLIAWTGKYQYLTWLGWFLTTLGSGVLIYLKADTSTVAWIFITMVSGFGFGILFAAMAMAIQAASSDADMGYAVNMFAFLRVFGETVGVAVGGVTFQNSIKRKLLTYPLLAPNATAISKNASAFVEYVKSLPPGQQKTELLESYVYGLRIVWVVCTALAALGLFVSLWTEALPLDRALVTEQGFKDKKKPKDTEKVIAEEN